MSQSPEQPDEERDSGDRSGRTRTAWLPPVEAAQQHTGARHTVRVADEDELAGFELLAGDRNLGTIEEIVSLEDERFYVVDTRHWTFGERRFVPAGCVAHVDLDRSEAQVAIDVELLRRAPDFNPFHLDDPGYQAKVRRHYGDLTT